MLSVKTLSGRWDQFPAIILDFLRADLFELVVDGKRVRGFRTPDAPSLWMRDYADMLRMGRLIEPDVFSVVDAFTETQSLNGRVFDYVTTTPEKVPCEKENWEKWVRVPVEADVEYRFVKAAYLAWQASGNDAWIEDKLLALDGALMYTMTHPWRWDSRHDLVKRAYTIDTWDFDYTAGRAPWLNFQINDQTYWGLFHGDNSGFVEACRLLAHLYDQVGNPERATYWSQIGMEVRERANALLFNGRFYTHFYKLTPVTIEGVDEEQQLSLSTPMAINRGMATRPIATSILQEYQQRRKTTNAFAEWFGIDPPFPDGIYGDAKLVGGAYINGGIFPLVGGELARAAFEHGFEKYGVETLDQYRNMIEQKRETFLWYFPDGTPASIDTSTSPDASPTDGWGSSAMLYGFLEGLCGIVDLDHSFRYVECAPRWIAAEEQNVSVEVSYAASGATFRYDFAHSPERSVIDLSLDGNAEQIYLHVLLPGHAHLLGMEQNGKSVEGKEVHILESTYADARLDLRGRSEIRIRYAHT